MLAPPPAHPLVRRLARFAQYPGTISGFRAGLFVAKLLLLLLPCAPYAANPWLMFVLLGVAALDVGILSANLQRSILLAGIHVAAVVVAAQHGYQCERPAIVWETSGLDASPLGLGAELPLTSSITAA